MAVGKIRAQRIVAAYPMGAPVEVWYDPEKPGRSTLKPGGAGWVFAGIPVVSVAGPLLVFASTPAGRLFLKGLGLHEEE